MNWKFSTMLKTVRSRQDKTYFLEKWEGKFAQNCNCIPKQIFSKGRFRAIVTSEPVVENSGACSVLIIVHFFSANLEWRDWETWDLAAGGAVCNRRLKGRRVCKWWVSHFLFVSSRNHCHEFFDGRFAFGKTSFRNLKVKRCSKLTSESLRCILFPSMVKRVICRDLEK